MVIMFNGTVLKDDKKPLKEHGVKVGFEFYGSGHLFIRGHRGSSTGELEINLA